MTQSELKACLEKIGVREADSEAFFILNYLFGVSFSQLMLDRNRDFPNDKIEPILAEREKKIPLQYILGRWHFMDIELSVSPECLIPRPDTEILVYEALKLLKRGGSVADLCTGSGCIGLSMLSARADISSMTLVDISRGALDIATANATELGLEKRCTLCQADITRDIPIGRVDMIVSNPPYIPSADIATLDDEVKNEPSLALDGGEDGLDIIRALIERAPSVLNEGGYLLIEFGYDQGDAICAIMDAQLERGAYKSYKIIKDYGKNDRVLSATV